MVRVAMTVGPGTMTDMSDLDQRVRQAAEARGLAVGEALVGGMMSAVFAATDRDSRDLVLKLPAAGGNADNLTGAEAAALTMWAATGASVSLVDATPDALLLTRARPGTVWPWLPSGSLDELVGVAADLLVRLWAAPVGPYPFPSLEDVYPQSEQVARQDAAWEQRSRGDPDRGVAGLQRLPAAAEAAEQLIGSCGEERLLHGDFISKNLVSDVGSPIRWVAIDPLPMFGDPAAEVAAFAAYHPVDLILPITEALAQVLGLEPRRALRWAAIWTIHQAAQAWRDDQQQLEHLVRSATLNDLLTA